MTIEPIEHERSIRYFIIDSAKQIYRVSIDRAPRLYADPPTSRFPQLAGQLVLFVLACVELAGRRPINIWHLELTELVYDELGILKEARFWRGWREPPETLSCAWVAEEVKDLVRRAALEPLQVKVLTLREGLLPLGSQRC